MIGEKGERSSMHYPKVTVVIPFYNDPYVDQAILSALNQTYPNVEIIVVDDGSTQYADRIQQFQKRVFYLGKGNGGTATALNHGIRMASGEYIAWLSSDDIFYPHKLSVQIQFMLERGALASYSSFDYINASGQITEHHAGPQITDMQSFYRMLLTGNPINGCTVVADRNLLLQSGLFDETLPYTHDYEMWLRLITSGIEFHYVNQSLIQYRRHDQMGTIKHRAAIEQEILFTRSRYAYLLESFIQG